MRQFVTGIISWIRNAIWTVVDWIKNIITSYWEFIFSVFNKIKDAISAAINWIKTKVTNGFNAIKDAISAPLKAAKSSVSNTFDSIKNKIFSVISSAKDTVSKGVNAIKGFFDKLKLNFPKIKLPHFSIKGEFSLKPPSVPKLAIDWYAKAMDNGMILNEPTIFGVNGNGQFMGAGEAGSETVVGTGSLINMIRGTVKDEVSGIP